MENQLAPVTEDNARLEYELTYCEIERERDNYLAIRNRVGRTAGLDSDLNHQWEYRQMRMDYLLDELFTKMVQLESFGDSHEQAA